MSTRTFIDAELAEGDDCTASYGDVTDHELTWGGVPRVRVTIIDEATGSDYSGGLHTRSNYEVMLADEDMRPHLIDLHGGYGTYGLAYRGTWEELRDVPSDDPRASLRDAIASLADYPILDDDHHSNMEMEVADEAWEDYGRQGFVKALTYVLDDLDDEHEHDLDALDSVDGRTTVYDLWREGCEAYNVNGGSGYQDEQGGGIYFYVKEWCDKARRDPDQSWFAVEACRKLREQLLTLAAAHRVVEEPAATPDDTQA